MRNRSRWAAVLGLLVLAAVLSACGRPAGVAGPSPRATPSAQASPPAARTLFADDFRGGQLDRAKWETCYPWAQGSGCTNFGNSELQWFVPQQVAVQNDSLHLQATREPAQGQDAQGRPKTYPYRSGMVSTAGHFQFTYGHVEFKARAPSGAQLWPAVWLLPASQAPTPEIDILEAWGQNTHTADFFYHRAQGSRVASQAQVDVTAWHTYALDWTPDGLTWYVDGRALLVTPDPPHEPMYLVISLAVDGGPIDQPLPSSGALDVAQVQISAPRPSPSS